MSTHEQKPEQVRGKEKLKKGSGINLLLNNIINMVVDEMKFELNKKTLLQCKARQNYRQTCSSS